MLAVGATAIGQQLRRNLNAFVYFENGTQATQELNDPKDPMNHIHVRSLSVQPSSVFRLMKYTDGLVPNSDLHGGQCFRKSSSSAAEDHGNNGVVDISHLGGIRV
jgi:hypothetical protein